MPTYEYHCNHCGEDMDIFQSIKEDHLSACPLCKTEDEFERKISAGSGIIFKGSGFYETDYKMKSAAPSKSSDSSSSKSDGKKDKKAPTKKAEAACASTA